MKIKRQHQFSMQISDREFEILENLSQQAGLSKADFLRYHFLARLKMEPVTNAPN